MKKNTEYEAVVGLETHVELSTATKMFCGCKLEFGAEANSLTCPVCLGLPGSLPVINRRALDFAVKIGLALNCTINDDTIFHRKNYFYADMAKNYQISQYDMPLGSRGYLDVDMGDYVRRVGITRIHMEEDTGKLVHTGTSGRISESGASMVDFNRSGTPLVEIVTEPDIKSPAEAKEYLISLRNLLLYLDVSDCSMEQGSLRCDANISMKPLNDKRLGTKVEIKNLNSFRFIQRGLEHEVERQTALLREGKKVIQQTRHYDDLTGSTIPLRQKEEAQDYRYFPDPDLVPMGIDKKMVRDIMGTIPELPYEKSIRYKDQYNLLPGDIRFLVSGRNIAEYFERCAGIYKGNAKAISNLIMGDFSALLNRECMTIDACKVSPQKLCRLVEIVDSGKISAKTAKSVFEEMFYSGAGPDEIIEGKGLEQISDEPILESIINGVIDSSPGAVEEFKNGKEKAIGFLIGKVMAQTKGKANPKLVNEMIAKKIRGRY